MLKQMGFIVNVDRCIGCKACETACKYENQIKGKSKDVIGWRRVVETTQGYLSLSCNHCDSPECFRVCPEKAFIKKRNGIVLIDPHKCNGCMDCVPACPYQIPVFDEKTKKAGKCDMCLPRQLKDLLPACVTACPTGALQIADFNQGEAFKGTVAEVEGFKRYMTKPTIRFYPHQPRKQYILEDENNI